MSSVFGLLLHGSMRVDAITCGKFGTPCIAAGIINFWTTDPNRSM